MLRLRCLNPGVVMLVALSLAIVGGGCSDDAGSNTDAATHPGDGSVDAERYPNQPGGDPLVPEVAALPYPSDFFLVADPTTKTGRRVAFVAEALPPQVPPKTINGADGFSRITPIVVFLPGSVDDATLPPADDPAATLKTSSPVLLVEAGTKMLVPILAENDCNAPIDAMRTLLIRPLRALEPKKGYVVILTNKLKNKAGEAHHANTAVRALLDGTPTGVDAIERQREAFVVINQTIAKLGIAKEDV
ncbi:MAG: hypothetical protein KAI47_13845, partial [Deltaproteobacteria bacterium]|nr:hypothetical protein [Deltaproteobacteria bacterium]